MGLCDNKEKSQNPRYIFMYLLPKMPVYILLYRN